MKKLFFVLLLSLNGVLWAADCDLNNDDGCDGPLEVTSTAADEPCDISIPDDSCPLPESTIKGPIEELDLLLEESEIKANKLMAFGCFSLNRLAGKYGVAVNASRPRAALAAFQRCRMASGHFGFACQRPQCFSLYY